MPKNDDQIAPIRGGTYYPAPDELDPNVEINLNSLRDAPGGGKPLYSYGTLIRYAIKGSPEGRLLLEEIYYAIEQRYPYFKTAPPGWKNSVRHNLSLNACFEKVPRPLTDRGKGSYWTVNDSIDPKQGIHRVRSRRRKNDKGGSPTPASAPYPPPFPGYGGAEGGAYDTYAAMYPYGYDPSMYPPSFLPPGVAPDMTGASIPGFEGAEAGMGGENDVDWRNLFVQELERLKSMTKEQDKNGAPQEWYRMMLMRLKMGMYGVPPFGAPIPPHPDAGRGPEAQHAQQQAQQQQHGTVEEEHEAEDEEDD